MKLDKGKQKKANKKNWVAGKLIKLIADRNSFSKKRKGRGWVDEGEGKGNYCMATLLIKVF